MPLSSSDIDPARWDAWVREYPFTTARQLAAYRSALHAHGHKSQLIRVGSAGAGEAGALVSIRRLPWVPAAAAMNTSGGIVWNRHWPALRQLLQTLVDIARRERAFRLEVNVRLPLSPLVDWPGLDTDLLVAEMRRFGFSARPDEPGTYIVSLRASSDEEILAGFSKSTRRDIRKAMNEGVTVERSNSIEVLREFAVAHHELSRRKGMTPLPNDFEVDAILPLMSADAVDLFVARWRDRPRNYIIVDRVSTPVYHWGATAASAYEDGCPPTGQLLQFSAMCHYRRQGRSAYDLGGAPGPVPTASHPNIGVWRFKRDFNGEYVQFAGRWSLSLHPHIDGAVSRIRRRLLRGHQT